MTPHPLDGARLKIVRAQEHLKSFNEDCWRYVSAEPYKIATELGPDQICIEGIITTESPPRLAGIVGDFVTNCRASLDYIAWELAMRAGRPLSDAQKRRIAFPLAPDKSSFTKKDGTAFHLEGVCGIPASAMSVIESVQPYHAGNESLDSLDLLVRTDKHRMLLLCTLFLRSAGKFSIFHGSKPAWKVEGMTRLGMNLTAFGPPFAGSTDFRVEVDEKPTLFVSLKDGLPPGHFALGGLLDEIIKCVTNIVPRFDQFFV